MAALTPAQYPLLFQDGRSGRLALYALLDVNNGDTVDLSALFTEIKRGVILGVTLAGSAVVTTISGTIVTIPGGAADAAALLVYGVAR
jgi:hypothetical protein